MTESIHARDTRGSAAAGALRFGIVVARFNSFITERLLAGALDSLRAAGASDARIEIVRVPGSFEIPLAAKKLAQTGRADSVIAIGCVLRGDTAHFDHIASEVARGLQLAQMDTGIPVIFCVLTCDTLEQAIDRAGLKSGNKGQEAALAAIEMANLSRALKATLPIAKPARKVARKVAAGARATATASRPRKRRA
jgi:6,7-dimethyl-8-ribityllumazine synthase